MRLYQGWSRGTHLLSRLIRCVDGVEWYGQWWPAYFNHTYLVFEFGQPGIRMIFESRDAKGIAWQPFEQIETSSKVEAHHEYLVCSDEALIQRAWDKAVSMRGAGYDFGHLFTLYLSLRAERKGRVARWWHAGEDGRYTCNEAAQAVLLSIGLDPNYGVCAPDVSTPERQFLAWHKMPSKRWMETRVK